SFPGSGLRPSESSDLRGAAACRMILQLDHDHVQLRFTDVLDRMRRQGLRPAGGPGVGPESVGCASVEKKAPLAVATEEFGAFENVLDVRPPMRVDRRRLTGGDL